MKFFFTPLFIIIFYCSYSQYEVNFEGTSETKTSYASGNVTLSGISWNLTEALIGTDANDYKNGSRSLRIRGYSTSSATMQADKTGGVGTVSFKYSRYGTDAQASFKVQYSTNGGSTWTDLGSPFTADNTIKTFSETINTSSNCRIRIIHNSGGNTTTNRRLNIDDIILSNYSSSNTISTSALSSDSFCAGNTVLVNFTSSGTFSAGNVYTVQLSDATGSFAAPTAIGSLASTANSGVVSATIPIAISYGTGYRIRVIASMPSILGTDNGTNITLNSPPTISTQPSDQSVFIPSSASFSVSSANATSYQWQINNGYSGWQLLAGIQSSTYTLATTSAANNGNYFRVQVLNFCGSLLSDSALLTVSPQPPSISVSVNNISNLDFYTLGPSGSKSFDLIGSSLTNPLTIIPPTNFQISLDDSIYSNSNLSVFPNANDSIIQKVYVRLASGTPIGHHSGNISLVSGSASKSVFVEGNSFPTNLLDRTLLARWHFNSYTFPFPTLDTGRNLKLNRQNADEGLKSSNSYISGYHSAANTEWTIAVGNGSSASINSNRWAVGDFYQFKSNTLGYKDLKIKFQQTRSSTGPVSFKVQYSTDSISFTDIPNGTYSVRDSNWSSLVAKQNNHYEFDLSSIQSLANSNKIFIRLVCSSAPSSIYGTSRVDSFEIWGKCFTLAGNVSEKNLRAQCSEEGFLYFGKDGVSSIAIAPKNYNFSAEVTIDVLPDVFSSPIMQISSQHHHQMFLLRRSWNVNCGGCSFSITNPVSVRFYFNQSEITDALNARNSALNNLTTLSVSNGNTIEWFKSNGVPFTTTGILGNVFPFPIIKFPAAIISNLANNLAYVQLDGITSFSGGTGGFSFGPPNSIGINALPVRWGKITATPTEKGNQIYWSTESETNTATFEIERSTDAIHFQRINLDPILAKGNSSFKTDYYYLDQNYLPLAYYRIKQIDIDQNFEYSKIVSVDLINSSYNQPINYRISDVNSSSILEVIASRPIPNSVKIQLYDLEGKVHKNNFNISNQNIFIDISMISSGMYVLEINEDGRLVRLKFTKNK